MATREVDVSCCPVSGVVVYLDRADVTREVQVDLIPGENEIVVKQLSNSIDSESIRVEGRGQARIGEVKYQEKHVVKEEEDKSTDVTASSALAATGELEREKDQIGAAVRRINAVNKRITKQRDVLEGVVKKVTGDNAVDVSTPVLMHAKQLAPVLKKKMKDMRKMEKVSELHGSPAVSQPRASVSQGRSVLDHVDDAGLDSVVSFMEFYGSKSRELDEKLAAIKKEEQELKRQLQAVTMNLELRGVSAKKSSKPGTTTQRAVTITVTCEKARKVSLFLSYVVMESGWQPQYDLRVFSKDKVLKIHYFAVISQSSGEDWEDAALVLSTAQPSIGGSPPELDTKKLQFSRGVSEILYKKMHRGKMSQVQQQVDDVKEMMQDNISLCLDQSEMLDQIVGSAAVCAAAPGPPAPRLAVSTAEVSGTVTSTSFEIPRKTTIPADGTGHKVSVAIVDLEPKFEYETVPKQVAHAFLKGQVKNSSQYALLQGPANVFLDNNFISKTSLDDVSPYEDFTCSLGVDPAVRVIYKPMRRFRETTGLFSKSTVVTMRQAIEVKNTRLDSAKIKVTDILPITGEETIKVSLVKPELSRKDPTRSVPGGSVTLTKENLLEWQLEIAASSQHTIEFVYNVEYPASEADLVGW